VNLAKISLGIVFVFIVCHSLKWIPNIYELMQVIRGRGKSIKLFFFFFFSGMLFSQNG
jgi:hypothetical protein